MERIYFIISATGDRSYNYHRHQRRFHEKVTLYIRQVSFANRDGMAVNKIWHTSEKGQAYKFSKYTAERIAEYLKGPTWRLRDVKVEPITVELNQAG